MSQPQNRPPNLWAAAFSLAGIAFAIWALWPIIGVFYFVFSILFRGLYALGSP